MMNSYLEFNKKDFLSSMDLDGEEKYLGPETNVSECFKPDFKAYRTKGIAKYGDIHQNMIEETKRPVTTNSESVAEESFSLEEDFSVNQHIEPKVGEIAPMMKPRGAPGEGCRRCILFDNVTADNLKGDPTKVFYCDVGFKSVLRRIRTFILKQVRLPKSRAYLSGDN